jgi:sucrose-6-phosphate hydrolase SacC (GH32 family)
MNPKAAEPSDFVQRLAYSNDRGRSWTMFAGNPVLKNITPLNRDPLVFWHAPSKRWVMVLYVGYPISNLGNEVTAQILNSENLKDWTYQSRIEGFYDCPMLYEIPLDGKAADTRWIIHCANMKYKVGRFDGKTFTPETDLIDAHKGKVGESAYASQIIRNAPDGRVLEISWLYNEQPGARQIMTFPSELSLVTTPNGPRLRWQPVHEIEQLISTPQTWHNLTLSPESPVTRAQGRHLEIKAEIQLGDAREVEFDLGGMPIVFHTVGKELTVRGYALPLALKENRLQLRVLLDETSLEIYADNGLVYLPLTIPPLGEHPAVTISVRGGAAQAETLEIAELKSIWPAPEGPPKSR